jgi:thiol-disulfide isomerase/thioredoxin
MRVLLFFLLLTGTLISNAGSLQQFPANTLAPVLHLKDLPGQYHSLDQYRGKVVLVNFWGSWCSTCIEEMPGLQRLQQKFKHGEFVVLAVNVNQTRTTVKRFLQKVAIDLTVVMDTSAKTAESWKVDFYPSSFIIDKSGYLRFFAIGKVDWDQTAIVDVIHRLITEK